MRLVCECCNNTSGYPRTRSLEGELKTLCIDCFKATKKINYRLLLTKIKDYLIFW